MKNMLGFLTGSPGRRKGGSPSASPNASPSGRKKNMFRMPSLSSLSPGRRRSPTGDSGAGARPFPSAAEASGGS